jgi:hydrogenase nickel incorporation protein HypA/HybF
MHELSIACSLVEMAEREARAAGAARVTGVTLAIGDLAGVVRQALDFAFDVATEGTMLDGATLTVETVPVRVFCPTCEAERPIVAPNRFRCATCDTRTADIRQGRELDLVSLRVEETAEAAAE